MRYEDDIPTKKETESESSRFQKQNEHSRRKKSIGCKKIKRQKEIVSLGHILCGLFFYKGHAYRMKYSESLKKTKDFQNVYRRGKSYANRYLVMYVLSNQTEGNRLGISVRKKVGNSVIRHHLTRLIRESYRLHEDMFNSGLDIVVVARSTAKDISYHEVESALLHLGGLHKIISKEKKMESF